LPLHELVREALDTVMVSGLEYVGEVLEEERTALCGPRYQHDPQRQALRAGSVASSLSLGGRRGSRAASDPQRGWGLARLVKYDWSRGPGGVQVCLGVRRTRQSETLHSSLSRRLFQKCQKIHTPLILTIKKPCDRSSSSITLLPDHATISRRGGFLKQKRR
jgi:hypothetical protein